MQGTVPAFSFSCSARRQERRLEPPVCVQTARRRHSRRAFRKTPCSSKQAQVLESRVFPGNSRTTHLGPFGEVIRATGPMAKVNPFMFSTKFYDWESGLYYYGYRYYNPSTGRWPSRDPLTEPGFSLLRQQASRVVSNNRIPDANTSTTSCSSCRKSQGQSSTASGQSKCQGKGKCQDDLYVFVGNDPISKWDYLGLNQPGCDPGTQWVTGLPGSTECYLKCCAQHDHCFDINHCKAWSAWPLMLCPWSKCGHCGWQTVACMAGCAAGGSGPDVGLYYCPNGGPPNQGTYYNNWSDIPASCFENGTPISQPPSWP